MTESDSSFSSHFISKNFQSPKGYRFFATAAGLKAQDALDVGLIFCDKPAKAAALFTRNKVQGAPLTVGREVIESGKKVSAVIVNSKNSNVMTGALGIANCRKVCHKVAKELAIDIGSVFPSSTGVIGRQLPFSKIISALDGVGGKLSSDQLSAFAEAIMTTDTRIKIVTKKISGGTITAIAKGAGMIEPNMATMLSYILTDLDLGDLDRHQMLFSAAQKSYHCVSIDTDTSTSDTVLMLDNGASGVVLHPSQQAEFQETLNQACIELARMIAADGEGVKTIITANIKGAADDTQARVVGKSIINSPLVKTAVAGRDPNWGRVLMAIGKTFDDRIKAGQIKLFIKDPDNQKLVDLITDDPTTLAQLEKLMDNFEVIFEVDLGLGEAQATVWGCDLTNEYIHINADYTT